MSERAPKLARVVEIIFGGLAKGTMVLVGVAVIVLAVLSGGDGLTDLPTTRKELGYFLLFVLVAIMGIATFIGLKHRT
jgi:hypothetical protein